MDPEVFPRQTRRKREKERCVLSHGGLGENSGFREKLSKAGPQEATGGRMGWHLCHQLVLPQC